MAINQKSRSDDLRVLEMLHLQDNEDMTAARIAKRLGVTRNTVVGQLSRIRGNGFDTPCECVEAGNKDGDLPARWWAA